MRWNSTGEGTRLPRCSVKTHHLPAHLQVRDVGVEINAVDALQIQDHMRVEEVIDIDRGGHGATST
jgi:hypothetical protein